MKLLGAEIIVRYLLEENVSHVFGIPGAHLLAFYDALYRTDSITPVLTSHESGASYMACGYAMTTKRMGVCCATVGPGATNLVSGVAAAYMDSLPLLVITPQVGVATIGKGALQESTGRSRCINQVGVFANVTKASFFVPDIKNLADTVRSAIRLAHDGRPGPVHMDIPANVLQSSLEQEIWKKESYRHSSMAAVSDDVVEKAAEYLCDGQKPGLLIGWGAVWSGAKPEIQSLVERLQIPFATTLRAKAIIAEDHPLSLGCVGLYGTDAANDYFKSGTDVLLTVGCSLHEFTTHCWDTDFVPAKAMIQLDVDSSEIGKIYPVTLFAHGDAKESLSKLNRVVNRVLEKRDGGRPTNVSEIAALKKHTMHFDDPSMHSNETPIKPQRLMQVISELLPKDTIVFGDIGNSLAWVERHLLLKSGQAFYCLPGLAAMGSGVAASVGAALVCPDRNVICICGDGDFRMTGMEAVTASNYAVPVIWIILNDSRLGMIYDVQTVSYKGRHIVSQFQNPDFEKLAESFGMPGWTVDTVESFRASFQKALGWKGPSIIDVIIDPSESPPLRPRMLALQKSVGLPSLYRSLSVDGIKAVLKMLGKS